MSSKPDFIIIGAMKCATSTLHEQLARQPGIFMTDPKEPCFFSDDPIYARGSSWYASLFHDAGPTDLCGESSTHYTKLPTYPRTVERLARLAPDARFVYVMRHPIDRLVSQYIHEWSVRRVSCSIDDALETFPELIHYSRYAMQLEPYFRAFGRNRVLPVFFERLTTRPQAALERICKFVGYEKRACWEEESRVRNASCARMRKCRWRDVLVRGRLLRKIRRRLVPKAWRDGLKRLWQMKERPQLRPGARAWLVGVLDEELGRLGEWLGVALDSENYRGTVLRQPLEWRNVRD